MDTLNVGDIVKVGPNLYSPVFMFTHRIADITSSFIEVRSSSGASLLLTEGHYIPVSGQLVAASALALGVEIQLGDGRSDSIVSLRKIESRGLYNPQTLHGDIVVDGIVASTYTTGVHPLYAHAFLWPIRGLFRHVGIRFSLLDQGGGWLVTVLPFASTVH
jgi:Hint module